MTVKRIKADQGLVAYISENILPRYRSYDKAHGLDHISAVISRSMDICDALRNGSMSMEDADGHSPDDTRIPDPDMVYTIAAYHDLGISEGREIHHISSGRMLVEDMHLRKWFNEEQIKEMKEAVEDHRASNDRPPRSIYGRIVSDADRLIDPDTVISRCILYGIDNHPDLDGEALFQRCLGHIQKKYGDGGYLKLQFKDSVNGAGLEHLRRLVRNPDAFRDEYSRFEMHPLAPFAPENAGLLMLGSFPPPASRWSMDFFYPNFINDMWRIMGIIHYGDRDRFVIKGRKTFDKDAIVSFCKEKGIALYDAALMVKRMRGNASDNFLKVMVPSDLESLLRSMPHCSTVVSTGGKSAETIAGILSVKVPAIGDYSEFVLRGTERRLRFYRMPSTSRAHPMPLEEKAGYYSKLF